MAEALVETLDRDDLDRAQRRKVQGMMLDDVDRLAAFIDDVLHASRLAHEGADTSWSDVDVGELARACAASVVARHHLAGEPRSASRSPRGSWRTPTAPRSRWCSRTSSTTR